MCIDWDSNVISNYATAVSAIISSIALGVAAYQIRVTRLESRRSTAHQIYKDYLNLAMENPQFSSASYPLKSPTQASFENNPSEYERYEFYVSQVLFAVEGILEVCPDAEWRSTLVDQLKYHALYLGNGDFTSRYYDRDVVELCHAAIALYRAERGAL